MAKKKLDAKALKRFEEKYDASHELNAVESRRAFLKAFPIRMLQDMRIDEYVIGDRKPTFCNHVEAKTNAWANIHGATAYKFGVYYGKNSKSAVKRYRFSNRFKTKSNSAYSAYQAVKRSLVQLLIDGRYKRFQEIDDNKISQLFKAKILSLYYPNIYLDICSRNHLKQLARQFGLPPRRPVSEYQHQLLKIKSAHPLAKCWTNPKFMAFLYAKYIRKSYAAYAPPKIKKPKTKNKNKVDFDKVNAGKAEAGKRSEKYALRWEKKRLRDKGLEKLISRIEDRRDRPGYGYDFLSFSSRRRKRFIEVKTVHDQNTKGRYAFYLSENQLAISKSRDHQRSYFFYLVRHDKDKKPYQVLQVRSKQLHQRSKLIPCDYMVDFQLEE